MVSSKNRSVIRIIFFVIILGVGAFLFFNENGIVKYLKIKSELNRLDEEIKQAELKLKALEAEIDSLYTSKVKIEKVARERYHMLRPNEQVLKIQEN